MNKKFEYETKVNEFYKDYNKEIYQIANLVKGINISTPLEVEDIISFSFYELLKSENKLEYFKLKIDKKENEIKNFFKKKIWNYMRSSCNKYKSKNHQILNLVPSNNEYIIENISEAYNYEELFYFLNKQEFNFIYDLKVNKLKRIQICKKMNLSRYELKKIETKVKLKLIKYLDIVI